MEIDLEELAAIIELLDKTEFTQFRFEKGELHIAVSRGETFNFESAQPAAGDSASQSVSAATAVPASTPTPPAAATATSMVASSNLAADESVVRSPMLGTFYGCPKPGEPAFVQEGQAVAADTTLCIIEVMKLMNSVPAGEAGEIRRVLVRDGDLVEYDQPLFVLGRAS